MRKDLAFAVVLTLVGGFAHAPALVAQSWVPGKGNGTAYLAYQRLDVTYHLMFDGTNVNAGDITGNSLFIGVDYGLTDRLAVSAAIPFVDKQYDGSRPHDTDILDLDHHDDHVHVANIDDGHYHGRWQDWSVGLRYNLLTEPISVTPRIVYSHPANDYVFFGHGAVGTRQRRLEVGIDAGGTLPAPWDRWYVQGGYAYNKVEEVLGVHTDYSVVKIELGYSITDRLSARVLGIWQKSHGGEDFPIDFNFPDGRPDRVSEHWFNHDRIQRVDYVNGVFAASYTLSDRYELFGSFGKTLWGENGHEIARAVTVGVVIAF